MKWISEAARLLRVLLLTPFLFALSAQAQDAKPFSKEQLDQLTAQIALYPDSLLAQLLMATTYPEDFAAAAAWSKAHPDAKGDDAVKMVENEPWDPSVASLVAFPEVLITFGGQPDWVRNIGDAFLAQPDDVMNSVQRLRQKAQAAGNLKSNEQVTVSMQAPEWDRRGPADGGGPAVGASAAGHRHPAGAAVGGLRAVVQPDGRVRTVAVGGVPAVLLPAAARLLVVAADRHRHRLGSGHWHYQCAVGRRSLGRGLGPQQRQHQRQPLQQHQRQPPDRQQQQERELESQSGSARQHAVPGRRLDPQEPREPARRRQPRAVPRPGREP